MEPTDAGRRRYVWLVVLFIAAGAFGFGAWQESFGAGFWMFTVLLVLASVCDAIEDAAKRHRP